MNALNMIMIVASLELIGKYSELKSSLKMLKDTLRKLKKALKEQSGK